MVWLDQKKGSTQGCDPPRHLQTAQWAPGQKVIHGVLFQCFFGTWLGVPKKNLKALCGALSGPGPGRSCKWRPGSQTQGLKSADKNAAKNPKTTLSLLMPIF